MMGGGGFDFDFNILTAFIRLGRARPAGAGCPPYYYYFLTLVQYIFAFHAPINIYYMSIFSNRNHKLNVKRVE